MKISKQILLITPILFIFFASGCSKGLLQRDEAEPDSSLLGIESNLEEIEEKSGGEDTSSGPDEKSGPGQNFGTAGREMPGDGSTGSFHAEPFDGDRGKEGAGLVREGGDAAPEPDSEFFKEENLGERDTFSNLYEKPGPPREFGSAEQGMPGNGSTGSFSAEPFDGDRGKEGNGLLSGGDKDKISEPFPPEKGEETVALLPLDEEVRRSLRYRSTDRLQDIHFAFDRYDLDAKSRTILQIDVAYLKSHLGSKIEIQGHCDERGTNSYNISLGERRARTTKLYLLSLGVDESRIRTISYGEERPFCFESNEECWYQNRRAHFLIAE